MRWSFLSPPLSLHLLTFPSLPFPFLPFPSPFPFSPSFPSLSFPFSFLHPSFLSFFLSFLRPFPLSLPPSSPSPPLHPLPPRSSPSPASPPPPEKIKKRENERNDLLPSFWAGGLNGGYEWGKGVGGKKGGEGGEIWSGSGNLIIYVLTYIHTIHTHTKMPFSSRFFFS